MSCPPIVRCPTCGYRLREPKGKPKRRRQHLPERSMNRQAKLSRPPITLPATVGANRRPPLALCRVHQTPLRIAATGAVEGDGVEAEDGTAVIAGLTLVSPVLLPKSPNHRHPSTTHIPPTSP